MSATWVNTTIDGVISKVKSILYSLTITPDSSTNVANCTLYNGENATEEAIGSFYSGAGRSNQIVFNPPLICSRGIYLDAGSNVGSIVIQYDVIKE